MIFNTLKLPIKLYYVQLCEDKGKNTYFFGCLFNELMSIQHVT